MVDRRAFFVRSVFVLVWDVLKLDSGSRFRFYLRVRNRERDAYELRKEGWRDNKWPSVVKTVFELSLLFRTNPSVP